MHLSPSAKMKDGAGLGILTEDGGLGVLTEDGGLGVLLATKLGFNEAE